LMLQGERKKDRKIFLSTCFQGLLFPKWSKRLQSYVFFVSRWRVDGSLLANSIFSSNLETVCL
jgi:hypothetical protein